MDKFDIVIIGAGVIGLAVAKELSDNSKKVLVVEKNDTFGQETSSRNSEVIHGGMYYPRQTLKANLCIEGSRLLYEACQKNHIPFRRTGKVIVVTENQELCLLENIFKQGKDNGVSGLKMLTRQELKRMEPNVFGLAALYSPQTGIIDSHCLMRYFLGIARKKEAIVVYKCEVIGIENAGKGYKLKLRDSDGVSHVKATTVVNCAGLDADTIAGMAGIDIDKSGYRLHYCKGQYFRVRGIKPGLINSLVYPVSKPKSAGLGIHATLDLTGGLRLGPDDRYLKNREKDYSVDDSRRHDFYDSARKFLPFLEEANLIADMSGIRPKLQAEGEGFRDFIIKEESGNGLPGLINLIGIESPGLTASIAIAGYVGRLIKRIF